MHPACAETRFYQLGGLCQHGRVQSRTALDGIHSKETPTENLGHPQELLCTGWPFCLQERHQAVVKNVTSAWSWEEVPKPWDTAAVLLCRWLGTRQTQGRDMSDLMFESIDCSSP